MQRSSMRWLGKTTDSSFFLTQPSLQVLAIRDMSHQSRRVVQLVIDKDGGISMHGLVSEGGRKPRQNRILMTTHIAVGVIL